MQVDDMIRHPLECWLTVNGYDRKWLYGRMGVTQAHLSNLLLGKRRPRVTDMSMIKQITNGAVTANDMFNFLEQIAE